MNKPTRREIECYQDVMSSVKSILKTKGADMDGTVPDHVVMTTRALTALITNAMAMGAMAYTNHRYCGKNVRNMDKFLEVLSVVRFELTENVAIEPEEGADEGNAD